MEMKPSTILVTGATGFVGSHVTELLAQKHHRVVVLERSKDPKSYYSRKHLDQSVVTAIGDLKDFRRIADVVSKYEIEYIVHLGAQAIVPTAYKNPLETIETNIMGTVHILEAARVYGSVRGIVVASSDKAYGKSSKTYLESDPLRGDHPYDASKSSADILSLAYHKTYDLPVVVTRFGNIYGPGDSNSTRIVPGIVHSAITGQALVLRSDGTFVRDYVYVADVARAYVFLLSQIDNIKGRAFNIAAKESMSVVQLIKTSAKVLNKRIPYTIENSAINEIPYQHLDDSAIRALGWKSKTSFATGLKRTYEWYRKHQ